MGELFCVTSVFYRFQVEALLHCLATPSAVLVPKVSQFERDSTLHSFSSNLCPQSPYLTDKKISCCIPQKPDILSIPVYETIVQPS